MKLTRRQFIVNGSSAAAGVLAASHLALRANPSSAAVAPGLVAKVVRVGGALKIQLNDRVYEPLAFRSFRPEERNIREFYDAGVRLMSVLHTGMNCTLDVPYSKFGEIWLGPGKYDFAAFDRQMDLFLKHAPDAYFNVMLQLDTRDWALKLHPDWSNCYWNLVEMVGHQPWRDETARFVQDVLRYVEGKYGDRVFAYSLFCGSSTEWYTNSQGRGRPEAAIRPHPIKEACFRQFTGDPAAVLPPLQELYATSHGAFRHPVQDAAALRYWKFHHQIIGDAIVYFAARSQEVLQHRKLLGLFYGYLTQLDGKRLLEEGHLGYERVWQCADLDMIFAPAKYGRPRAFEGTSGFLLTVDSLNLGDKLVFHECDHTSHIAPTKVENGRAIPGANTKFKDAFQTRMVLRREFAMTRAKGTALWWFDFFGGYYYDPALMAEVANMVRVQQRLRDVPMKSVAQVAVFGDVDSMYYPSAESELATDLLVHPPDELARIGAPYDIYNFSDLDHPRLPLEQYRLCVFLNAFLLPPQKRQYIRRRVEADGRTLLWLFAPNYVDDRDVATEGISQVTGITVAARRDSDDVVEVPATGPFSRLGAPARFGFGRKFEPRFEVRDREATVLGTYVSDGAAAVASKRFPGHTSVYCAVGRMPAAVYREVARAAGVHIYYDGRDPTYINSRLFGIHMQSDVEPAIVFPGGRSCRLEELFDGGKILAKEGRFRIPHEAGATKLYLVTDAQD